MNDLLNTLQSYVTATAIAILSGLGVGSGGLLVIWLTAIGVDTQSARALNLLFFVFSASAAFALHFLKGRINLPLVTLLSLAACVGTAVGFFVGDSLSPYALRKIFGVMLALSGSYTLFGVVRSAINRRNTKEKGYFSKKKKKISKSSLQNENHML